MGKERESRKKDGRLPVGRKGPSRGSPSRETCRVKPEIGPGKTKSGTGPPFRCAAFCCRCLLRRSCRFATSGRRIGYRRFSAGILSFHEEIPTRRGLSPERVLSWLRGDGVGLLPPAPESMSSEREGRKDGLGRLSNRTRRAGCFRSVQDDGRRAERAGRPVFRFLFRFDEKG